MQKKTSRGYRQWIALIAMSLGTFMGLLDVTVVNVALPTMAKSFNESFNNLQWVLNAYTLILAVSLLVLSKLGDMFGRRKIFIASLILFMIASAVNGMATNLGILVIGRGVQAIGGAGMNSLSMALVASNFSGRQRGIALGILGSVIGLSTASGPLIGGYLVGQFGWPSIFFVNVPVGIITVILTIIYVKETPSYGAGTKIDWLGMVLSAVGLFSGVYGLIQKEGHSHWAWTDMRIAGWLIAFAVIFALFILVENRVKAPMMDLNMFKSVHFVGAIMVALALGIGIYSFNAFLTALMQNYIGYSALQTGVRQLVMSIWSLLLGPITGILGAKYSKKWIISAALFVGGIGFIVMANAITVKLSYAQLWPGMVLYGIANGLVNPMLNTAGMEGTSPQEMGMASGLLNVFRQLGSTIGVVGLGLVQSARYENYINGHIGKIQMLPAAAASGLRKALFSAGPFSGHQIAFSARVSRAPFAHGLQMMVLRAYHSGMVGVLFTAAGVLMLGSLAAATLMREHHASKDIA